MHDGLLNFHSVFLDTLYKGNVDVSREGPCLSTNFPTKDFAPNVEVLLEFTGSCISHNPQLFSSPPTLAVWHRPFKCTLFYRVSPKKIEYPLKRDRNDSWKWNLYSLLKVLQVYTFIKPKSGHALRVRALHWNPRRFDSCQRTLLLVKSNKCITFTLEISILKNLSAISCN
jgi:hypothetical protein